MMNGFEISVKYRGYVKRSDATGLYISWSPMLDIKSQGRTAEEARAALDDSIRMFVVQCLKRGILEDVLKRRGLEPCEPVEGGGDDGERVSVRPLPAIEADSWDGSYLVPFHIVAAAQNRALSGDGSWQRQ